MAEKDDDAVLAKHLEFTHRMADRFQRIANIYYQSGVPKEMIASVFFGAGVDSMLIVFDRDKVIEILQDTIATVEDIDDDDLREHILPCAGSA